MFYLDRRATFQGNTAEGLAIFAVKNPTQTPAKSRTSIDPAKIAQARAEAAKLLGA